MNKYFQFYKLIIKDKNLKTAKANVKKYKIATILNNVNNIYI